MKKSYEAYAKIKTVKEDKMPEGENEPRVNEANVAVQKAESGNMWRISTFLLAVLLIGATAGLIYFYSNYTTTQESYNKLVAQNNNQASGEEKQQSSDTSGSDTSDIEKPTIDIAGLDTDIQGIYDIQGSGSTVKFKKFVVTNDGKYLFAVGDVYSVSDDNPPVMVGNAGGAWYRALGDSDSDWARLSLANGIQECSKFTDAELELFESYSYIDDDLGSRYMGCQNDDGTWIGE